MRNHDFVLRISLLGSEPEIWRRLRIPARSSFEDLHRAIQAFGWGGHHLWIFRHTLGMDLCGPWDLLEDRSIDPAGALSLDSFFRGVGERCRYLYDFGDGWNHDVVLESVEVAAEAPSPELLDGAERLPPDDCGGLPGYEMIQLYLETGELPAGADAGFGDWVNALDLQEFDLKSAREIFCERWNEATAADRTEVEFSLSGADEVPRVMDRRLVEQIVDEIGAFSVGLGQRLGVRILPTASSFTEHNVRLTIEAAVEREDGVVMDKQAEEFLRRCHEFGLAPGDLGRLLDVNGTRCRVAGLRPRAKNPVLCEPVEQGEGPVTRFALTVASLRAGLEKS